MGLKRKPKVQDHYQLFDKIDGHHPLQDQVEDFCVLYNVRTRPGGKVAYFNFSLAKEMGLIEKDHPHDLNEELEEKLLQTFRIVIINEYDLKCRNKSFKKSSIKDNKYMATRYLQLQHKCKRGSTSGDGRSIWNGHYQSNGITWDIMSCGTGATCLSPATASTKKFFKTGDPKVSYGCGYADLLDGMSSALMSEIFHGNGIGTERILCIIQYPNQGAINIRVGKNLLRPSHLFRYLKQSQYRQLGQIVNYYIDRQISNGDWVKVKGEMRRYDYFLKKITETFSYVSALFEAEYIFCWMEWDGDNILMDGGIIDYGSIRQFGLYHHEYRYDDVDRMSTNITEQKNKSKFIVKTFIQLVDFLKTGKKKNLKNFNHHPLLKDFDHTFKRVKYSIILRKVGFNHKQVKYLFHYHKNLLNDFFQAHFYFESYMSNEGILEIEDGVTQNAIFCMRDLLRNYPKVLLDSIDRDNSFILDYEKFISLFLSSYADDVDLEKNTYKVERSKQWQLSYQEMIKKVSVKFGIPYEKLCADINILSHKYNKYARITGDSIIHVSKEFISYKNRLDFHHYNNLLEQFIKDQIVEENFLLSSFEDNSTHQRFLNKIVKLVINNKEGL